MLTTTTNIVTYSTNGSATVFAVPFSFWDASELVVVLRNNSTGAETTLTITTNYTVSGGEGTTGSITSVATYASGYKLQIKRIMPVKQELDLSDNDEFPAESVEQQLDKVVAQVQQINTDQSFNLKGSSFTTGFDFTLPNTLTADRGIKVNAAGTGFELTDADPDSAADSAAAAAASAVTASGYATDAQGYASDAQGYASDAEDAKDAAQLAAASVPTLATLLAAVYPVGTIYSNETDSRNPATIFGFTSTWVALEGVVVVGYKSGDSDFGTAGATVGAKTVTLDITQIPPHTHSGVQRSDGPGRLGPGGDQVNPGLTDSSGGGLAHNNIQPSLVAYVWKRTA